MEGSPEITSRASNPMMRFFSKPVVGVLGSIASIVGLLIAVFFYTERRQARELTYYVHPAKAIVARAGQTSRLSMTMDNKPLASDITAAQVAFWNAGDLSIKADNILRPLRISIGAPIIEAIVRKKSREVVDIGLDNSGFKRGELAISWNILEKNDGAIIQIIYAEKPDTPIFASATIEGQDVISRLDFIRTIRSPAEQYEWLCRVQKIPGYVYLVIAVIMMLMAAVFLFILRRRRLKMPIVAFTLIVSPALLLAVAIFELIRSMRPGPPFGF
jgi:hypothetical protein